ncbi:MAG: aminotransferase class I/II-fold pyridoxal phosphate-dependent enzyme, partial [bacterium]
MSNNLAYLEKQVEQLKEEGVYRELPISESPIDNRVLIDGKEVINLSSNNYLGLATDKHVMEAAIQAIKDYGAGTGSVRTIIGNQLLLEKLEELLAEFKREEAVTVFQSGLNCNIGTIQAIVNKGDLIVSDELNHASIIDGVKLSRADKAIYKHSDMVDLERILKEKREDYNNVLIITDGVFSMDGDLAKLPKIVELAKKYDCLTYVD